MEPVGVEPDPQQKVFRASGLLGVVASLAPRNSARFKSEEVHQIYVETMLIDSDFHDYYDTVQSYGIDKAVVYRRKTEKILIKERRFDTRAERSKLSGPEEHWNRDIAAHMYVVGFCGKLYPVISINKRFSIPIFFYEVPAAEAYLDAIGVKRRDGFFWSSRGYHFDDKGGVERFFKHDWQKEYEQLFQEHKVPVFIVARDRDGKLNKILNPKLRSCQFMKVKGPPTAFQEIYQFISGVLGTPARPTLEIADKYKAIAHGHDGKYSFRKPPGGGQWR